MRIPMRIGLLLLFGFIINAAVVVRTLTWGSSTFRGANLRAEDAAVLLQREFPGVQLEPDTAGHAEAGAMISWMIASAEGHRDGRVWGFHIVSQSDVGWPARAFRGVQLNWGVMMQEQTAVSGMMVLPNRVLGVPMPGLATAQGRLIPVRPLWGGLLVNTLLYATFAGAAGWIVMRTHRRARLDRRRCGLCGYDLCASLKDHLVRCPECGAEFAMDVFRRPRQVLRLWMIVYCVPLLALGGLWLFSDSLRSVRQIVRIKMHYYFGWAGLLSMAVLQMIVLVSAYSLAERSYADRSKSARIALAAMVSLALTALCAPPVFIFMHGLSAP